MYDLSTPFYLRKRYFIVFLAFLGYVNLYTMRVNLSVAIVAITDQNFDWNSKEKGFALGAFFYGYVASQVFGGILASKYGGHIIFNLGIFGSAIFTLLTPVLCYQGIWYLIATRVAVGIFSGIAFPSANDVYSRWIPPLERSRSASYGISGGNVGTIFANLLSGWLSEMYGWEWIFYVFGAAAIIWNIVWFTVVYHSPDKDPWITKKERAFINESLKNQTGQKNVTKTPWKSIFTAGPVYTIAIAQFCYTWGYFTLLTQLPLYMDEVLHFDIKSSGMLSALPYFAYTVLIFFTGYFADWFLKKKYLSTTQVRKYFNNFALLNQMGFLMIAAFVSNKTVIIACITLSVGLGAFAMPGYFANTLDIAPQYASIILGFTNTIGALPGMVSPILSGYIATTPSVGEYRIIFLISCGIYLFGAIVYGIFATGEIQPWALMPKDDDIHSSETDRDKTIKEISNI